MSRGQRVVVGIGPYETERTSSCVVVGGFPVPMQAPSHHTVGNSFCAVPFLFGGAGVQSPGASRHPLSKGGMRGAVFGQEVPAQQPPVSPLKGGQGAAVAGSAGCGAYRRVRDAARYGVAMV